jgi:hypothetical protein
LILEDRLGRTDLLSGRLQQTLQVHAHAILIGDQAGRRIGEAVSNAHLLHFLGEHLLNARGDFFEFDRVLSPVSSSRLVFERP